GEGVGGFEALVANPPGVAADGGVAGRTQADRSGGHVDVAERGDHVAFGGDFAGHGIDPGGGRTDEQHGLLSGGFDFQVGVGLATAPAGGGGGVEPGGGPVDAHAGCERRLAVGAVGGGDEAVGVDGEGLVFVAADQPVEQHGRGRLFVDG